MKPAPFEYVQAASLDDVFGAIAEYGDEARIVAGGQSLMPILNMRLASPRVLIDINGIAELSGITVADGVLRIGALTRHRELLHSPVVAEHAPLLRLAAPHIAHPAIRNRGTFGGSLCHADPAAELPACIVASGACLHIRGPNGSRAVDAADFFAGVFETALAADEVLTAVDIPLIKDGERVAFDELARRHGDYAIVGLAAKARTAEGTFSDVSLVFFSIADRPLAATNAAAALQGQPATSPASDPVKAALLSDLAEAAGDLHTTADAKRQMAAVLLDRVLADLAGGDGA